MSDDPKEVISTNTASIRSLFERPAKLLLKNWSILLLFAVLIAYNFLVEHFQSTQVEVSEEWLFETFPTLAVEAIRSPLFWCFVVVLFLVQNFLGILVSLDLFQIFRRQRKGIIDSFLRMRLEHFAWFFAAQVLVHLLFGIVGLSVWYVALRMASSCGMCSMGLVTASFVAIYPIFYICLSVASLVAVFPVSSRTKWEKLSRLLAAQVLWPLYIFYFVRLSTEFLLLVVVPWLAWIYLDNPILAWVSILAALILPFSWLRGSAYELKLRVFSRDRDFRSLFVEHYKNG